MSTKTLKVGYRLVRNATSTADKAPYLGVAVPVGSLTYDNVLQRMLDRGTFMTRATAQYFLNEFYEFAAERIAEDLVRINMGAVSLYPMIGGAFDSEDDSFRALRNTLYIGATLSQDVRDAVAGVAQGLGESRDVGAMGHVGQNAKMPVRRKRREERHHGRLRPGAAGDHGLEANGIFCGEAVEIRRSAARIPIATEVRDLETVHQHEKHVRPRRSSRSGHRRHQHRESGKSR